eukprot:1253940-Amphidinium_carterae.1
MDNRTPMYSHLSFPHNGQGNVRDFVLTTGICGSFISKNTTIVWSDANRQCRKVGLDRSQMSVCMCAVLCDCNVPTTLKRILRRTCSKRSPFGYEYTKKFEQR